MAKKTSSGGVAASAIPVFLAIFFYLGAEQSPCQTLGLTFHIWVDPIHGDDDQAFPNNQNLNGTNCWYNPRGGRFSTISPAGAPRALQQHQSPASSIGGYLNHAPYAFKTVGRAIAYIKDRDYGFGEMYWYISPPTEPEARSWKYPGPGEERQIDYIIIHCLPGLYGPIEDKYGNPRPGDVYEGFRDGHFDKSGLPFNGEEFPLQIPPRVSIQGTSALDTIFDAREWDGTVIECPPKTIFELPVVAPNQIRKWTFIDSITVRNARLHKIPGSANELQGAGIRIGSQGNVYCAISNCFIINNAVGIAIWNITIPQEPEPQPQSHNRPIIVNNTIAGNGVGIYSGYGPPDPATLESHAYPLIVNNIIDSGDLGYTPYWTSTFLYRRVPFWGVHRDDVSVSPQTNGVTQNTDFNAYNEVKAAYLSTNLAAGLWNIPGWSDTLVRNATPQQIIYSPRVKNFKDYAGYQNGPPRGSIYICDIFRNCPLAPVSNRDISPHDFRLAPLNGKGQTPPSVGAHVYSPILESCVNTGIDDSIGNIYMVNDYNQNINIINTAWVQGAIGMPPGLPADADLAVKYQAWGLGTTQGDVEGWDCEGFGNPRVATPNGFDQPGPCAIDIGADELDDLIIAGYAHSTRHFCNSTIWTQAINNDFVFFFRSPAGQTFTRPDFNELLQQQVNGSNYPWLFLVNGLPYPWPVSGNYTRGLLGSNRNILCESPTASSRRPFMWNWNVTFSPYLILDYHPFWDTVFNTLLPTTPADIFAANPWVNSSDIPYGTFPDNHFLFWDSANSIVPGDSTINPPNTWLWGTYGYLHSHNLTPTWSATGVPTQYSINNWGWGDANGVDTIPCTGFLAKRINCQLNALSSPQQGNIQTFLYMAARGGGETYATSFGEVPLPPISFYSKKPASKIDYAALEKLITNTKVIVQKTIEDLKEMIVERNTKK